MKISSKASDHLITSKIGSAVTNTTYVINQDKLISNFRRVLYVVRFLLGNSPASSFYMSTFRNTLSVASSWASTCPWRWNRQSVPKRRHIKLRCRGITQKKTYNKINWFKALKSDIQMGFQNCPRVYCATLLWTDHLSVMFVKVFFSFPYKSLGQWIK